MLLSRTFSFLLLAIFSEFRCDLVSLFLSPSMNRARRSADV